MGKISEGNPEKGEERKIVHFGNRPMGWESFSATHAPDVTTGDALSEFSPEHSRRPIPVPYEISDAINGMARDD